MSNKPILKTTNHTTHKNIDFILVRKQVKNIGLKVKTTGEVQVTAHNRVPLDYIINLVDEKSEWINKHLEKFKNKENNGETKPPKTPLTYTTGEQLYYLGEAYVLEVEEKSKTQVYIKNNKIRLEILENTTLEKKQQMLEKWYKEQCSQVFQEVLNEEFENVKDYILGSKLKDIPALKLRKMKSCWGVCHYTKGYIVINTELIKYDMDCIRYVIVHELMHFKHPNHSKDFYKGLSHYIPNYKGIKERLKSSIN